MHVTLQLSDNQKLMASDIIPSLGHELKLGNQTNVSLNMDSKANASEVFEKLSAGGSVEMPFQKVFWGAYFGNLTDKYGIGWMVNYDLKEGEK